MKDTLLTLVTNILLGIVAFICTTTYAKLSDIQKDIVGMQLEITKINSTILTREDVREIVIQEIEIRRL